MAYLDKETKVQGDSCPDLYVFNVLRFFALCALRSFSWMAEDPCPDLHVFNVFKISALCALRSFSLMAKGFLSRLARV